MRLAKINGVKKLIFTPEFSPQINDFPLLNFEN